MVTIGLWHFRLNRTFSEVPGMRINDKEGLVIAETFEAAEEKIKEHIKKTFFTPGEYSIRSIKFRAEVLI